MSKGEQLAAAVKEVSRLVKADEYHKDLDVRDESVLEVVTAESRAQALWGLERLHEAVDDLPGKYDDADAGPLLAMMMQKATRLAFTNGILTGIVLERERRAEPGAPREV